MPNRIKWGSDDTLYPEGQRSNFTVKSLCATKTLFWPLSCSRSRRGDCDCISRLVGGWMRDTNLVHSPWNSADCIDLLSDCWIFCSLFTATDIWSVAVQYKFIAGTLLAIIKILTSIHNIYNMDADTHECKVHRDRRKTTAAPVTRKTMRLANCQSLFSH